MMAALVFTGEGPVVVLTRYESLDNPGLIEQLHRKGIDKFIAFEIPIGLARRRYGRHFETVVTDVHETDEIRLLDWMGSRAFKLFSFKELGRPFFYEPAEAEAAVAGKVPA
jgi:hypothetical protein